MGVFIIITSGGDSLRAWRVKYSEFAALLKEVAEVKQRSKSNTHRLDEMKEKVELLNEVVTSVKLLAQAQEEMVKEMKTFNSRLSALEDAPKVKWDKYTTAIVTAVITICITLMVTRIFEVLF